MHDNTSISQAEITTLQRIVEAIDDVYYANVHKLNGDDLNRLSTARGEAAFLLDRAKRRVGREVVAA